MKPKEQQALLRFKEKLEDIMKPEYDDVYLCKWLKGKSQDRLNTRGMGDRISVGFPVFPVVRAAFGSGL